MLSATVATPGGEKIIVTTIHIGRVIRCLPYAGFLFLICVPPPAGPPTEEPHRQPQGETNFFAQPGILAGKGRLLHPCLGIGAISFMHLTTVGHSPRPIQINNIFSQRWKIEETRPTNSNLFIYKRNQPDHRNSKCCRHAVVQLRKILLSFCEILRCVHPNQKSYAFL